MDILLQKSIYPSFRNPYRNHSIQQEDGLATVELLLIIVIVIVNITIIFFFAKH